MAKPGADFGQAQHIEGHGNGAARVARAAGSMSDQPDNLVLERLREIRQVLGEVREDTADMRLRVGMQEAGYAPISLRLDRLAGDVKRIKRPEDKAA
jgi:hypothetical protein